MDKNRLLQMAVRIGMEAVAVMAGGPGAGRGLGPIGGGVGGVGGVGDTGGGGTTPPAPPTLPLPPAPTDLPPRP
jgi:hypothetical protein